MKRIIILLCIIVLVLCGCGKNKVNDANGGTQKEIIVMPDKQTAENLNGYVSGNTDNNEIQYVVNKKSKKFHYSECEYAKNIKENNKILVYNRSMLIGDGYSPCGSCKP